jgi:beta-lactamase class D
MMIDRREFLAGLVLSAGPVGIAGTGGAAADDGEILCSLVVEAGSGRIHHRSGPCERRFSPASTFKIPLAVMGFEAGILIDAHTPRWEPEPGDPINFEREKAPIDPTAWEALSVVWYSQHLTRRLGIDRFRGFVEAFDYGNRDVSGNPGKNDGLTRAWLSSSLTISPDEQVGFVRRLVDDRLPVSAAAQAAARSILPSFTTAGGWSVHGKTGSGRLPGRDHRPDPNHPTGWFVGWADKGDRRVIFARFRAARDPALSGLPVRASLLADLDRLAGD